MREPESVTIKGRPLKCPFCEHDRFHVREILLNQKWLAVLDLQALSLRGKAYVCADCGLKQEFMDV